MIFEPCKGIITFMHRKKGFGFIKDFNGPTYFFHASAVCNADFKDIREGMEIEFSKFETPKGPKAIGVIIVK